MGYGMLPIDMLAMRDIFGVYDEWGLEKVSFETLHDKLCLPPDFQVKHIAVDWLRRCYVVMLEAPSLPEVAQGQDIAQVMPVLTQENGVVRLHELQITPPSGRGYW